MISDPNSVASQLLFFVVGYLTVATLIFGRERPEQVVRKTTSPLLKLTTALILIAAAAIPFLYRVVAADSTILAWECESVLAYFGALQQGQSFRDFAWESIKANPGVLSASARSIFYGLPTFEVFSAGGASIFSLRIVAFLAGLLSLIPAYFIAKHVFNATVALLFVAVLASNPLYLFYMGYGVSQTGTLLGFLVALGLSVAALRMQNAARFLVAILAGVALFVSMYNYSPERIFVVITVAFLIAYAVYYGLIRGGNARGAVAALMTSIVVAGLFGMVKWLDPWSEFFTARGEQVFTMLQTRWHVASYLGDTAEVQSYDPANPSLLLQAKFFLAVVHARFVEFLAGLKPVYGTYPRGSHNAPSFPLYQSALLIPLLIGFTVSLRSFRQARSVYLLAVFFGGLVPLLLTTRFDRHRAFFLLIPLSLWIAHGLSLCLTRLESKALGRIHVAVITLALGAGLIGNAWFYLAIPDATPPEHAVLAEAAGSLVTSNTSVAMGLECAPQAPLVIRLLQLQKELTPAAYTLWDHEFGKFLTDARFTPTRPEFVRLMDSLERGTSAVLITDQPTTKFRAELQARGYTFTEEPRGSFVIMRVAPKR